MDKKELATLPKYRVHQEMRLYTFKADIIGCFWTTAGWKYEVSIRRGKKKGDWIILENSVNLKEME